MLKNYWDYLQGSQVNISFIGYETQLIDLELTEDNPVKNLLIIGSWIERNNYGFCHMFGALPFIYIYN